MYRDADAWISEYESRNAFWIHDGNPRRPHALLTSGKHSNGFFNSELVMEDANLLDEAAFDLLKILARNGLSVQNVDRVVGPAMGAITLAHEVARHIGRKRGFSCLRAYTEKEESEAGKIMVFKKTVIRPDEQVLPVEDVLTTGTSVDHAAEAIRGAGGVVVPFVAVLVNRSGLTEVRGKKIIALIDREMPMWKPHECPLCAQGSEALRPKENENWSRLNANY